MKLILAQGNPGTQYARTRHNVGFIALDAIASSHDAAWKQSRIAAAETAEFTYDGEKILLIKPGSFYNETGTVAQAFVQFYKLDPSNDVLVVHDELALPFGTIRVRAQGSDAGNNGIKSLVQHLGANFWRIRVGIWNEERNQMDDAHFVLSAFNNEERDQLEAHIKKVATLVDDFIHGTLIASTH